MVVLVVLHFLVCIFLILAVLIQPGKEESLGAMLGGSAAQNLFGSQTTTVLTRITMVLAAIFMVLSLVIGAFNERKNPAKKAIDMLEQDVKAQQAQSALEPTPIAPPTFLMQVNPTPGQESLAAPTPIQVVGEPTEMPAP